MKEMSRQQYLKDYRLLIDRVLTFCRRCKGSPSPAFTEAIIFLQSIAMQNLELPSTVSLGKDGSLEFAHPNPKMGAFRILKDGSLVPPPEPPRSETPKEPEISPAQKAELLRAAATDETTDQDPSIPPILTMINGGLN